MFQLASPLQVAAVLAAVGWPFVAGLAVVLWSKSRAADRRRKLAQVDAEVAGLYRTVESEPVPDRLAVVVEALEEAEALKPRPKAAPKPRVGAR